MQSKFPTDIPAWPKKHFPRGRQPAEISWRTFWKCLLKFTSLQPWQLAILWQFYHGYTANWMWRTYSHVHESQYESFYYPGCTLCAVTTHDRAPTLPLVYSSDHDRHFHRAVRLIRDNGGGEPHLLCDCPVSKRMYCLINRTDLPYQHVTDMMPPNRLSSDALNELARYLRATLLLFKETRLSESAPVIQIGASLQSWIQRNRNRRYIMTGKGQHKF